jgi:hypothetical protein
MSLLPILLLAAGLNGGIPAGPTVASAPRAQARLNHAVAAAAPRLQREAIHRALAGGTRRLANNIAREIASGRPAPAKESTPAGKAAPLASPDARIRRAKTSLDRQTTRALARLRLAAVTAAFADETKRFAALLAAQLGHTRIASPRASRRVAQRLRGAARHARAR